MGEGQVGCGPTCGHAGGGCTETVGDLPARILPSLPQVILKGSSVPRRGRGTPHTLPASWLSRQAGREWPPYPLPRPRPAVGSCRIKERKFGFGFPSGTCRVILRISSKVTPLLPTLQLTGACPCRGGAAQAQPFGVPVWASAPGMVLHRGLEGLGGTWCSGSRPTLAGGKLGFWPARLVVLLTFPPSVPVALTPATLIVICRI